MLSLLEHARSVASTNDEVARWVREGCVDGRALWVDEQTDGRGRRGRTWESQPGENLALSIAIAGVHYRPVMLLLPLAAAVGTASAIERVAKVEVGMKWPNDLMVDRRKLAGILCEAVLDGARFEGAVVGIGVNVNTPALALPPELQAIATSLIDLCQIRTDIEELAGAVRHDVCEAARALAAGDTDAVLTRWRARDATLGRRVVGDGFVGVAAGIGDDGSLLVECTNGVRAVRSGEIRFV